MGIFKRPAKRFKLTDIAVLEFESNHGSSPHENDIGPASCIGYRQQSPPGSTLANPSKVGPLLEVHLVALVLIRAAVQLDARTLDSVSDSLAPMAASATLAGRVPTLPALGLFLVREPDPQGSLGPGRGTAPPHVNASVHHPLLGLFIDQDEALGGFHFPAMVDRVITFLGKYSYHA